MRAVKGATPTATQLAVAHAQRDPSLIVSHGSAAMLWEMWLPGRVERQVHLTRQVGQAFPRIKGVRGHRLLVPDDQLVTVRSSGRAWTVTSPTRTWTDLASLGLTEEELVVAGDALLRRADGPDRRPGTLGRNPLSELETVKEVLNARPRLARRATLTAALARMRPRVDSPRETWVRLRLVDAGYPEPAVNVRVVVEYDAAGRPLRYRDVDLGWEEWRIGVQYEGEYHFAQADQRRRDMQRDEELRSVDWEPLRVDRDVFTKHGWDAFRRRLDAAIAARS